METAVLQQEVQNLAAAAKVRAPELVITQKSPRRAMVERGRDGDRIVLRSDMLNSPPTVLRGVLAHEVAHVARGDPALRFRMRVAAVMAIWLIAVMTIVASVLLAWPVLVPVGLVTMLVPRAVQLAVYRRQEYEADRLAIKLLLDPAPMAVYLDWALKHQDPGRPLLLRLWTATHPPLERRIAALARVQPTSGR